jgi:hypothetical protein
MSSVVRRSVVYLVALLTLRISTQVRGDTTSQPSSDDETIAALKSARQFLANNPLELSRATTSYSEKFCVTLTTNFKPRNGVQPFRLILLRDHERVSMILQDLHGNDRSFITNNLLVAIDHRHPGKLIVLRNGFPKFVFDRDTRGQNLMEWSYSLSMVTSDVMISFRNNLQDLLDSAERASFDPTSNSYTFLTSTSISKLTLADPKEESFRIKKFENARPIFAFEISVVDPTGYPAQYGRLISDVVATKDAIENSGLPVNDLTNETDQIISVAAGEACMVPIDFGKDPAERDAILKLTSILTPATPSTRTDSP